MEELVTRITENLVGRLHGPLTLRLLLQPMVAIFFATRAGLRDAREGRVPYFWALIYDPVHRRGMLREGWRDVGKVFVIAVALDVVYQMVVFRWLYPGETLIVACALALLPYLITRGLVTRIARGIKRSPSPRQPTDTPGTQP